MDTRDPPATAPAGTRPYPGAMAPGDAGLDVGRSRSPDSGGVSALRDEAQSVARGAADQAADVARSAKANVDAAADQAKRKAAEYAQQAFGRGRAVLDDQKHRAAEQLHLVGDAARRAADRFREERDDNIAGYVDAASDEVNRLADYLDGRDVGSLVRDAQQFARRRPEWFLGGMFMAGLVLTRFLKASSARSDGWTSSGSGSTGSGNWSGGHDTGHSRSADRGYTAPRPAMPPQPVGAVLAPQTIGAAPAVIAETGTASGGTRGTSGISAAALTGAAGFASTSSHTPTQSGSASVIPPTTADRPVNPGEVL